MKVGAISWEWLLLLSFSLVLILVYFNTPPEHTLLREFVIVILILMVLKKKWPFLSKWMGQNFLSIFILTEDVSLCAAAQLSSVQFSSVTQSCPTLWDSMDCSTPGLPIHHQLPEFTQTHVLWVSDAIQPSHDLSSPSPPPSIFPSIRIFSNESVLCIMWPKYWHFSFNISPSNEHPGLIFLGWIGWISLQSKGLWRVFSNTTVQRPHFFGAQLSL